MSLLHQVLVTVKLFVPSCVFKTYIWTVSEIYSNFCIFCIHWTFNHLRPGHKFTLSLLHPERKNGTCLVSTNSGQVETWRRSAILLVFITITSWPLGPSEPPSQWPNLKKLMTQHSAGRLQLCSWFPLLSLCHLISVLKCWPVWSLLKQKWPFTGALARRVNVSEIKAITANRLPLVSKCVIILNLRLFLSKIFWKFSDFHISGIWRTWCHIYFSAESRASQTIPQSQACAHSDG